MEQQFLAQRMNWWSNEIDTGLLAWKNKIKQTTGAFITKQTTELQQRNIVDRPKLRAFRMESFDEKYALYSKNNVLCLIFDNSIRTRQATDQFVSFSSLQRKDEPKSAMEVVGKVCME